jgi:hypothetical protein
VVVASNCRLANLIDCAFALSQRSKNFCQSPARCG